MTNIEGNATEDADRFVLIKRKQSGTMKNTRKVEDKQTVLTGKKKGILRYVCRNLWT